MKLTIAKLVLKWLGVEGVIVPSMDPAYIASAKELCSQMDGKSASGEYKRAKVVAGLINRHEMAHKDASLLVELVLCGAVS